jgi:Phosphatidylinositol 3- and 4-kinase
LLVDFSLRNQTFVSLCKGKLFHIDFGFILGRDPKPLPPPMKLSKEMVEAMGGPGSEYFTDFKRLCYTAFLHLRRYNIGHTARICRLAFYACMCMRMPVHTWLASFAVSAANELKRLEFSIIFI